MVQLTHLANDIENAKESGGGRDIIPSGKYIVACIDTVEKQNRKKTGSYIMNTYEVQEGEHVGAKLVDYINYDNPNETARDIAMATLKSLGIAVGISPLQDTNQLIGKRIVTVVENKEGQPILDDQGQQKTNDSGQPLFYREIRIKKYQPVGAIDTSSDGTSTPVQSSNDGFPSFPE